MWNTWDNLGDAYTDCLTTVKGYSAGYVFAGSRMRYQGQVWTGDLSSLWSTYQDKIQGAVAARGYRDVTVDGPSKGLWIGGQGDVVIEVTAPIDQGSDQDVKANIDGAISTVGLKVSGSTIFFTRAPKPEEICSGRAKETVGREGGGTGGGTGTPKVETCGFSCEVEKFLGSNSTLLIAVTALVGVVVLKNFLK